MDKLTSILVIADRSQADRRLLEKAVALARTFGAVIELYTCDSEHAADLRRAYDTAGVEKEWLERVWAGRDYLEALRESVPASDVQLFIDSMCDSRLHEAVAKKIHGCHPHPDLVMKSASKAHTGRFALDAADWELMRTCPVSLMLTRGRRWSERPRFAAMVDMGVGAPLAPETPSAAQEVMHAAEYLAVGCRADLDVVYCERDESSPDRPSWAALTELARAHQVGAEHVHVLSGEPDESLPAFAARNDYDVIVLGALTHRKRLANLMGRLTGRIAEALDCDILLVKGAAPAAAFEHRNAGVLWQAAFGD